MQWSPILALHISAGIVGLFSGTAAMIFRKGSVRHAQAGNVFVASMLTMAATAIYLAALKHQDSNIGGGILTFYLIGTAWLTARRRDGETSPWDWVAMVVPLLLGTLTWMNGVKMLRAGSQQGGFFVGMSFFMGTVLLLAAAGDLRMLLRGGLFGKQRIVRHLWRMCLGLFIATGSFFLGQGSKIFPSLFKDSPLLFIPAFLPLLFLLFWVVRLRFTNVYKKMFLPNVSNVQT
jgi:uncharacterized membrane protein